MTNTGGLVLLEQLELYSYLMKLNSSFNIKTLLKMYQRMSQKVILEIKQLRFLMLGFQSHGVYLKKFKFKDWYTFLFSICHAVYLKSILYVIMSRLYRKFTKLEEIKKLLMTCVKNYIIKSNMYLL